MSKVATKSRKTGKSESTTSSGGAAGTVSPDKQAIQTLLSGAPAVTLSPLESMRLQNAKVKQGELILFTTQLSVMLDSGVVLSDALDAIAEQAGNEVFRTIIMSVSDGVKNGETLSSMMCRYPRVFNPMFISMVRASEASGTMAQMLNVLTGYLTFEAETRKRIKGALTYPFIMALMAVAATGTLMFFVLPRFMRIYEAKGAALPKLTRVLVGFSRILGDFQAMTTIVTALIILGFSLYCWSRTLMGRRIIDYLKIRTPIIGTMFVDTVVTRSMRIMATMVNTGVRLLDSIQVIQGSCDNYHFQRLWQRVDEKIRDGYQLSESITIAPESDLIAPGIIQMLRAGEKSGKLGEVCDKVSVFYEKKLEASIRNVMAMIEPVMILLLGGIIGTIAIALLLPVFRISSVIAH